MWCIWLLARAFGANRAASVVAASAVVLVPGFLQQYSFVTPHALDIPVGAFTALATLKYLRREWPVWVLPLAALTIAGVKGSNIVVAVAVGITLAAVVVWPGVERRDRIRAFIGGVVLTVSTLVFFLGMQSPSVPPGSPSTPRRAPSSRTRSPGTTSSSTVPGSSPRGARARSRCPAPSW